VEGLTAVRLLEPRDVDAVLHIQSESPEAAQWSRSEYARLAEPDNLLDTTERVLVAESSGPVAGFLAFRRAADEVEITNLAVARDARRRGVGSKLLEVATAAATCGDAPLFVEVRESNATAIAFYQRHGFAATGRRPRYYCNPDEDALLLTRAPRQS